MFCRVEFILHFAQKEAKEFLEKEWNAQFWSRTTSLTEEEYFADEDNWDRAMKHGYDVVNMARGFPPKYKQAETEEEEEDDDDDDDEEEEGEGEEVEEVEGSTDTGSNVAAKPSSTSKKTEDVTQVRPILCVPYCMILLRGFQACGSFLDFLRVPAREELFCRGKCYLLLVAIVCVDCSATQQMLVRHW